MAGFIGIAGGILTGNQYLNIAGKVGIGAFVTIIIIYLIVDAIASLLTAIKSKLSLFHLILIIHPIFHFGYGIGFLHGIINFIIRRGGVIGSMTELSR